MLQCPCFLLRIRWPFCADTTCQESLEHVQRRLENVAFWHLQVARRRAVREKSSTPAHTPWYHPAHIYSPRHDCEFFSEVS
jgi:hypothetical protein